MELHKLRSKIDSLDKKIVGLLNKRASVTVDIGKIKKKAGKNIYCPDRESQVLKKAALMTRGPLSYAAVESIYREIMSGSLLLEKGLKIAYLGPQATFTHLAALKKFGSQLEYIPCNGIADVFLEVEKNNADYGVVPIENSVEGAVSHTLDMFVDSDLKVCAQIIQDIAHNLLAKCPLNEIKRIYSNPQVFGQCRIWLQNNLPKAELIEVSSTTHAAQIAANTKKSACIASLLAAKIYKLKSLARSIEDSPHNRTRFLVIGKTYTGKTNRDRTSILFSIKDKVGALYDMLTCFKKYRINLTKIESRPSKKKAWDYYFFVDLEGHKDSPLIKKALEELDSKAKYMKVLGSYPVGE
ncbi:MAG: prephenate dehydratase [Candidatus Omnitrophota bacterium]